MGGSWQPAAAHIACTDRRSSSRRLVLPPPAARAARSGTRSRRPRLDASEAGAREGRAWGRVCCRTNCRLGRGRWLHSGTVNGRAASNPSRSGRWSARIGFDGPHGVSLWLVRAERTGADGSVEMPSEPGVGVRDPGDGVAQPAADCFPGAFDVVGYSAGATAQAVGGGELGDERVELLLGHRRRFPVAAFVRLVDVGFEFGDSALVLGQGRLVDHWLAPALNRESGLGGRVGGDGPGTGSLRYEIEDVDLAPGFGEQVTNDACITIGGVYHLVHEFAAARYDDLRSRRPCVAGVHRRGALADLDSVGRTGHG